ncbi:hypothetical protein ACFWMP_12700 [Paenibacillus sp. NPDC058367]|uniref:hypothetical protein n=1 Tax=Paenibacillus sp. NPDC058367 TaxID=3346460 RepID=UPI00364C786C
MNLVTMKQKDLDTFSDERLGWACMEPTFQQIRAKSPSIKSEVISKLTDGQKALCMFRVMHDHSRNSEGEYYAWISYMQDLPGYWTGVMGGIRFFGDDPMILLLQETKAFLEERNNRLGIQWVDATITDLDRDPELLNEMSGLYERFKNIAEDSHRLIGEYIRAHPGEFVEIEGSD